MLPFCSLMQEAQSPSQVVTNLTSQQPKAGFPKDAKEKESNEIEAFLICTDTGSSLHQKLTTQPKPHPVLSDTCKCKRRLWTSSSLPQTMWQTPGQRKHVSSLPKALLAEQQNPSATGGQNYFWPCINNTYKHRFRGGGKM